MRISPGSWVKIVVFIVIGALFGALWCCTQILNLKRLKPIHPEMN